jgi:hypothetical protein
MKTSLIVIVVALSVVLVAGAGEASKEERHESSEYEHSERQESKIYGTIQKLPSGLIGIWDVDGKEVSVTRATIIREKHGEAEVGAYVEIKGSYSGKALVAREIEVKRAKR